MPSPRYETLYATFSFNIVLLLNLHDVQHEAECYMFPLPHGESGEMIPGTRSAGTHLSRHRLTENACLRSMPRIRMQCVQLWA